MRSILARDWSSSCRRRPIGACLVLALLRALVAFWQRQHSTDCRSCGNMASLKYTHAVVCRIPLSFRTRAEIELEEAKRQHEAYVRLLRELGLDVIELPPDESLPECVYVEDTAIVCNGIALITRPGSATRSKEASISRRSFPKKRRLGDRGVCCNGVDELTYRLVLHAWMSPSFGY